MNRRNVIGFLSLLGLAAAATALSNFGAPATKAGAADGCCGACCCGDACCSSGCEGCDCCDSPCEAAASCCPGDAAKAAE